jgi:hypothetical protein
MIRQITIATIYSPPKHTITCQEYENVLLQLGPHFLVAGDWNAKHTAWRSRVITPKGRVLLNVYTTTKEYSVVLVRKRTIPIEQSPPVSEASANFSG